MIREVDFPLFCTFLTEHLNQPVISNDLIKEDFLSALYDLAFPSRSQLTGPV